MRYAEMTGTDNDDNTVDEDFVDLPTEAIILVLTAGILIYALIGQTPEGVDRQMFLCLSIFGSGLLLWQTRVIPYTVSSLLIVSLLFISGISPTFEEAAVGFSSTLFFFFFVLLVLGNAIAKVDIDGYAAQHLLKTSNDPSHSIRRLGGYLLAVSFLMPSGLARMVAFTPVVEEMNTIYGLDSDSSFLTSSFLILGQLNPVASISLMTGGGLPIIGSALIRSSGYSIEWLDWAIYMAPPTMFIFVTGVVCARVLHPPDSRTEKAETVSTEHSDLTREQLIVGAVMGVTLIAWAIGSIIGIPTILPAIGAVAVLSAPHIRVFSAEDIKDVNWGILFLIGSMLSLIEALESTGAFDWIIRVISAVIPFSIIDPWLILGLIVCFMIVSRLLFPNGSTCLIVVMPIIINFAEIYNLNVLYTSFATVLIIGSTVLLPLNIPPALLASNKGHVSTRNVFAYGIVTMVISVISVTIAWNVYWPIAELLI